MMNGINHISTLKIDGFDASQMDHICIGKGSDPSEGIYTDKLSTTHSEETHSLIAKNHSRAISLLSPTSRQLVVLNQVHSPNVVTVDAPLPTPLPEADAVVTKTPGLAIGIMTADCVPVLFYNAKAQIIAATHAGWRGAFDGVLEATIHSISALGGAPTDTMAAIGPCIQQQNFEVGIEFFDRFTERFPKSGAFFVTGKNTTKKQFDLTGFCIDQLTSAGISQIFNSKICTVTAYDRFFSYRGAKQRRESDIGRNLNAIVLRE